MKLVFLGLLLSGLAATAQTIPAPTFTSTCQYSGTNSQKGYCETRDLTMPAPTRQPLSIDGGANGSISVRGWDGPDVRIRAKINASASTEAEAQASVKAISISTAGNRLYAQGKEQRTSVSYEVFVPRRMALALTTQNGSIAITELQGAITFRAQNGGVSLAGLGGQVVGKTVNGSLAIKLSGSQWEGNSLDVETVNGSINWQVPADYSAEFFTSTNNGSLKTTLPQREPQGNKHEVKITLGKGGHLLKAVTINGGVVIKRS